MPLAAGSTGIAIVTVHCAALTRASRLLFARMAMIYTQDRRLSYFLPFLRGVFKKFGSIRKLR